MSIQTAFSLSPLAPDAVAEIKKGLANTSPKAILLFSSIYYSPQDVVQECLKAFPQTPVFGCTTAGELVNERMLKHGMVAMALDESTIEDIHIELIPNLANAPSAEQAFSGFEKHLGVSMANLDMSKYVGIVLTDGLSGAEETLMDDIGNRTNVPFIGGAAGDDLAFSRTFVFCHGQAHTNAAVLVLLKPRTGFSILKTQSFLVLPQTLVATKVNETQREVLEFNNKPAVQAYAEAIGIPPQKAAQEFMHHPVGLMIDGDPFVRSPQQVKGDSLRFYCRVKQGMELKLLESTNIVKDTGDALQKAFQKGPVSGIINFHCILRTLELEKRQQTEAYGNLFRDIRTIGFSTYGEEYLGHINQTSTMLLFR